jgi:hypothetical protein
VRSSPPRREPSTPAGEPQRRSRAPRIALGLGVLLLVAAGGAYLVARSLTGASLSPDATGLAHFHINTLGGKLASATATGPGGQAIPVVIRNGRVTPRGKLDPGERVRVDAVFRRPSFVSWALGSSQHETLTITAPVPKLTSRYVTLGANGLLRVSFSQPIIRVVIGTGPKRRDRTLKRPETTISVHHVGITGTVKIAVAASTWEHPTTPTRLTYFPAAHETVAVANPAPGHNITPVTPLRITFSNTVAAALGSARPTLTPNVRGHWKTISTHEIEFRPSGAGLALGSSVTVHMPHTVAVVGPNGRQLHRTQTLSWTVPAGSMLRLHQILAQKGYLPVDWKPAGKPVAHTPAAEARAAVQAPAGKFTWRYSNTPHELVDQWTPGEYNQITKGALMTFENANGMATDGVAGPAVWKALLGDARSDKGGASPVAGYTYVYVHSAIPQKLTLWHDGHTILTSPGNTGIASAPTQHGTFPVFEHLAETTMQGINPDGSHYDDPGIKWVSYFNGGDALHAFPRASFGTPQSLGCVELPLASAAKIWPYTPIGTLVTIED